LNSEQKKKDETKDELDYKIKRWTYNKARYVPFIASGVQKCFLAWQSQRKLYRQTW
jgi:hypothetical protein